METLLMVLILIPFTLLFAAMAFANNEIDAAPIAKTVSIETREPVDHKRAA